MGVSEGPESPAGCGGRNQRERSRLTATRGCGEETGPRKWTQQSDIG